MPHRVCEGSEPIEDQIDDGRARKEQPTHFAMTSNLCFIRLHSFFICRNLSPLLLPMRSTTNHSRPKRVRWGALSRQTEDHKRKSRSLPARGDVSTKGDVNHVSSIHELIQTIPRPQSNKSCRSAPLRVRADGELDKGSTGQPKKDCVCRGLALPRPKSERTFLFSVTSPLRPNSFGPRELVQ